MTSDKEEELLNAVPQDGSRIGNTTLIRQLGWPEDEYWEVRNRLVDRGVLQLGVGRGGSVQRRVNVEAASTGSEEVPNVRTPSDVPEALEETRVPEADLYVPIAKTLEDKWVKDKRVESAIVHITAQQGGRYTGGRWTRPDVTVATLSTYPYVPGRHFDVITFEVKPSDALDVTAVYEALAHSRSGTRAYLLVHVPDALQVQLEPTLVELASEAKRHGIGLIVVGDPADYGTWEERVDAERFEPDPRRMNDFLAQQLRQDQLERIVRWFR